MLGTDPNLGDAEVGDLTIQLEGFETPVLVGGSPRWEGSEPEVGGLTARTDWLFSMWGRGQPVEGRWFRLTKADGGADSYEEEETPLYS